MLAIRRSIPSATGKAFLAIGLMLPTAGSATEITPLAPALSYELEATDSAPAEAQPAGTQLSDSQATAAQAASAQVDEASLECMAKIVHHEAHGQPRSGQVAVAQTLMNRLKAGRFGGSVCDVANQPHQFFHTASYNPPRDSAGWTTAVEVSRSVLLGQADEVAPGALFFRAAYGAPGSFFRQRQRVATVGGQVFYR